MGVNLDSLRIVLLAKASREDNKTSSFHTHLGMQVGITHVSRIAFPDGGGGGG